MTPHFRRARLISASLLSASLLSTVIGLSACDRIPAGPGGTTAAAPRVDTSLQIQGTVTAPGGQTLDGAQAMACLTPRETCAQEASAPVTIADGVGRYVLTVPAKGDYHVTVWKDVNGDGQPNAGDLLAFAHNLQAVPSGQRLTPMAAFVRTEGAMTANTGGDPLGAEADLAAAAAAVKTAGLAGRWSQSSSGSELVWGPEIKFQAASATVGFGSNLGGTFGAGSPTNTTIVYSYKPVTITRAMTLDVSPDGTFHWSSRQDRQKGKCRSVRQEKYGRVRVQDGKLTFVVADARQSCGDGRQDFLEVKDETYDLSGSGAAFRLTGEHGVDWTFNRS